MEQLFDFTIRRIKEHVPRRILELAFMPKQNGFATTMQYVTLDAAIEQHVIRQSLLMDVQLISGHETTISLEGLPVWREDDGRSVIKIPLERTGGRPIIEAHHINFFNDYVSAAGVRGDSGSTIERRIGQLVNMSRDMPLTTTSRCKLVGPNLLAVDMDIHLAGNFSLTCTLEADNFLSHVTSKAFPKFGQLAVAKAKSLIYNNIIVDLDEGMISRGQDLGVIRELVGGYSDAAVMYDELLQKWRKTETFLSHAKLKKHIQAAIPK